MSPSLLPSMQNVNIKSVIFHKHGMHSFSDSQYISYVAGQKAKYIVQCEHMYDKYNGMSLSLL